MQHISSLLAVTFSLFVAACGGGGSGAASDPPVGGSTPPTVSITSIGPSGQVAPTTPVSYEVKVENADSAAIEVSAVCDGQAVPVNLTGIDKTGGTGTATPVSGSFPDGASCQAMVKATAQNADGPATAEAQVVFTTTPAAPARIYYERANLVVSGETFSDTGNGTLAVGYPQLILGTTLVPLKNETGFQVGGCMLSSGTLGEEAGAYAGLPSARCLKPSNGNVRAIFPIDPVGQKLLPEYSGSLPAGLVYYAGQYGTFGDSPYVAQGVSQSGMFIDVPGVGTYYYTDLDGNTLWLTRDGFTSSELLQTGQTFKVLMTYTNPAPAPLRYSVIMGMPSGSVGLPARITGDTCATAKVEEAVNETSYPEVFLNFALYNSMLHTTITPSGLVFGTSQVVAEAGQTMSFHYNPVTNKWTDDDGSLGTAPKYTPFAERDAGWVFNSAADHPDPAIGGWAQNDKLLVYVTRADGNQPLCEDVVNGVRSGLPVALDVSHDDFGTWFGFWHFKKD